MAIEYANPFAAFTQGLRATLLQQETKRRQEEQDQLARDRESRIKASDTQSAELRRLQIEGQRDLLAQQEFDRKIANLMPGDAVSPEMLAEAEKIGRGADFDRKPAAVTQGAMLGEDEQGVPQYEVNKTPGVVAFKGTPKQRQDANVLSTHTAMVKRIMDDPTASAGLKQWAQFAKPGDAPPYQLLEGSQNQTLFRTSADRRSVQRFENGQWVQHTGEIPKDAHWLQEPTPPASVTIGNQASDEGIIAMAEHYMQTGQLLSRNPAIASRVMETARQMSRAQGVNPVVQGAQLKADQGTLTQVSKTLSAVTAFENTAQRNIKLMQDAMKKITDTGVPFLNQPIRKVQGMVGSADIARFNASARVVIPEIARILAQPNLTGALTDTARHEMEQVVRGDATVEQMNAVIELLLQDMAGRKKDLTAQKKAIEDAIKGRGPRGVPGVVAPGAPTAPAAPAAGGANDPLGIL